MMINPEYADKQNNMKELLNKADGISYMCTECNIRAYVWTDPIFDDCHEKKHSIEKFVDAKKALKKKDNEKRNHQDLALFVMADHTFKTMTGTHEVLYYENGVYKYGAEERISQRCRVLEPQCSRHDITEVIGIIQDKTGYLNPDDFDADENIINVRNGLVNIRTGEIKEHTPDYLTRIQLPVRYDRSIIPYKFLEYIWSTGHDYQNIYRIFEMMGACLIKNNTVLTKAWMHIGPGSDGKSIALDTLTEILGSENVMHHGIYEIETQTFIPGTLDGKLANIADDIGADELKKTSYLKKLIGGSPISGHKKFLGDYNFRPYAKLIFSANQLPETHDQSDGFARRWEIIEWPRQFLDDDKNPEYKLIHRDETELSGVFNIMVAFARGLLTRNRLKYETTVNDSRMIWKDRSSVMEGFVTKMCTRGEEYEIEASRLRTELARYCVDKKYRMPNPAKIKADLEKMGVEWKKNQRRHGEVVNLYLGLCLKADLVKEGQSYL